MRPVRWFLCLFGGRQCRDSLQTRTYLWLRCPGLLRDKSATDELSTEVFLIDEIFFKLKFSKTFLSPCHSSTVRPDSGCLDLGRGPGTHSERHCGRGGVDLRGVADGAVAPRPPDADVVVLAGQVVLRLGHRARARVPVEAGDCT